MKKLFVGIDDSKINRAIFEEAASIMDMDVITAENGLEGLDKINTAIEGGKTPEVVMVDIHMPVMNGLDFIKKFKENPITKYIPVIVLTTEVSLEPKMLAKDYGAAGWIIKPLGPEEIVKVIQKFLQI